MQGLVGFCAVNPNLSCFLSYFLYFFCSLPTLETANNDRPTTSDVFTILCIYLFICTFVCMYILAIYCANEHGTNTVQLEQIRHRILF